MPQSLSAVYVHLVFSTYHRDLLLGDNLRRRMHAFLGGIANGMGCQPLAIGGVADHVHMLIRLSRTESVSSVVSKLKSNSSAWAKREGGGPKDFQWQSGYGAFSVGVGEIDAIRGYIDGQEDHHRRVSFQDEYRQLLREHGMEFDEAYVWD